MPINPNLALIPAQGVQAQGNAINNAFNSYYQAQGNKRQNALLDMQEQNNAANQERQNALFQFQGNQENRAAEQHQFTMQQQKGQMLYKSFQALSQLPPDLREAQIELMKPGLMENGFDDDDWEILKTDEGIKQGLGVLSKYNASSQATDPSSVREYQYFSQLNPDQQEAYLTMKRANPSFKMGDVTMKGNQLNAGATPYSEETGPTSQAQEQEKLTKQSAVKAATVEATTGAIKLSTEAFERIAPIKTSIANYSEVSRLIDEGAETGVIAARLPSFKRASIELDNLQGKLGLDVVGNTTFGALSESELKFALDTALPKNLEGPALKAWVERKKAAQEKLLAYTEQAATFLGTPGNTVADWIDYQKSQQPDTDFSNKSDDDLLSF